MSKRALRHFETSGPRAETAQRILQAARELAIEKGLEEFTVSQIASHAGVSRMTVYRYWDDTDAVIKAALNQGIHEVLMRHIPTEQTLDALVDAFIAGMEQLRNDALVRALGERDRVNLSNQMNRAVMDVFELAWRLIYLVFRRVARHDPRMRGENLDTVLAMVFSFIFGAVMGTGEQMKQLEPAEWRAEVRRALYGYLSATPPHR